MLSMDDLHMDILRFRKYLNFIDFVVLKKSLQTVNAGESVEKRELSCTVGGNVNWYSHYGEQYGDSFKN